MSIQPQSDRVIIFDTTLRDGEQSPGATLNVEEKLAIAHQLALLGVDIIEAGFAAASPGDFAAIRTISEEVGATGVPIICSLARAIKADIQAAALALQPASHPRIHTMISTSEIHLKYQLKKSQSEVLAIAEEMVAYAKSKVDDVEFSPMDASRTDPEFLYQVLSRVIAAGATTINIPDTVGYYTPKEMGILIQGILDFVPDIDRVILSVHTQNDLGLATANALAAIEKEISDLDLEAIVRDETQIQVERSFQLEHVQVICGDCSCPTATITVVTPDGEILTDAAVGAGPVDAVYRAINRLVQIPNQLIEFSVQSVTEGIDALGTVTIRLRHEERIFSEQASDTDIVVAAAYAYINALNRLYRYLQSVVTLSNQQPTSRV